MPGLGTKATSLELVPRSSVCVGSGNETKDSQPSPVEPDCGISLSKFNTKQVSTSLAV